MSMITVSDLIELALPPQTAIVAGKESVDAEVSWATRPRPSAPAFDHLSGGELVLLTQKALTSLDQRLTLDAAIRQLSGFGVAAIAFAGKASAPARQAADESRIPLLQLPVDADLALLEREASHIIAERKRDSQRVTNDAGRRLMEQAIAGESLPDLAASLAEMADLDVIIEARDGRLLAMTSPTGQVPTSSVLLPMLERGRPAVMSWLRGGATVSSAEPPTTLLDWDDRSRRVVSPITGRDGLLGVLSMLLPGNSASQQVTALASRGAAACAVVMARERAAAVARQELELNVLDEVLDGALRSEVSLLQQARLLGYDLDGPHLALVARIDRTGAGQARTERGESSTLFAETLDRRDPAVLWRYRNNHAEVILPVEDGVDPDSTVAQIYSEVEQRVRTLLGSGVSVGIGGVYTGSNGIRKSHQEARQALTIGRRLNGQGKATRFSQLGIYRLLFAARELPELRSFHDDTLQALIEYDRKHNADLVRTLGAFFDGKCGPKEAAAILGVHRNTVLYRLQRIQDLSGLDLDDAEVRLRLHLAYCSHVALYGDAARVSATRGRSASH